MEPGRKPPFFSVFELGLGRSWCAQRFVGAPDRGHVVGVVSVLVRGR